MYKYKKKCKKKQTQKREQYKFVSLNVFPFHTFYGQTPKRTSKQSKLLLSGHGLGINKSCCVWWLT